MTPREQFDNVKFAVWYVRFRNAKYTETPVHCISYNNNLFYTIEIIYSEKSCTFTKIFVCENIHYVI
jgi:hypothetical protein